MVRVGGDLEGRRNLLGCLVRLERGYRNAHAISHFLGTKVERTMRFVQ
jgi:hypothetical protein